MTPSFNRDAIHAHVTLLHQLADGIDGIIPLFCVEEGKTPIIHRFGVGQIADVVNTIMGSEAHPGLNIYMPWAVMRPDLEPGKKGGEADIIAVLGGVGDVDNDKYQIGELPVEASCVIESSAGNYQPGYPFSRPISVSEAKPILEALSDAIGGDGGTKDASHVWRVPGTLNWPTRTKLMRGRSPNPQQVTIKKAFDGTLVIPEELAAKLPAKKTNGHASPDYEPSETISDWEEGLLRSQLSAIPSDDYHTWVTVGMALHTIGRCDLWDEWSATSEKFDAQAQPRKWASFKAEREGGVTTGTITKLAVKHGWTMPPAFSDWIQLDVKHLNEKIEIMDGERFDNEADDVLEDANDFPDSDLILPGYTGRIADWIMSTSPYPARLFSVAAALTVVSALTARHVYCSVPRLSTSGYMLMIGGTGGGKDRPRVCVKELLKEIGVGNMIMANVASASSLGMQLIENPATLQVLDEAGQLFRKLSNRNSSNHEMDLENAYCELWSNGLSDYTTSKTTMRGREQVVRAWFGFLGATTPAALHEQLRSKMVANGFLNRFMVLQRHKRVPRNRNCLPNDSVPAELIATGRRLFGFQDIRPDTTDKKHFVPPTGMIQNSRNPPNPVIIEFASRAVDLREHIIDERDRMLVESDRDDFLKIWTRYADMTQRIALIVACGRCADDGLRGCVIEEPDMIFAERLVRWSIESFITGMRDNMMAENEHQANSKLILRHIKNAKGGKLLRRDLMQALGGRIDARQLDGIIRQLVDGEQIFEARPKPGGVGRRGTIYSTKPWP